MDFVKCGIARPNPRKNFTVCRIENHLAKTVSTTSPAHQAWRILHFAFVVAPVLAGLDKFFHLLVNWDMYLAPAIARLSPIATHQLMQIIGVVEMIAGILVGLAVGALALGRLSQEFSS